MKRWLIVVVVILAVALIGGAGYWGFTGNLPFAQQETQEPIKEPPTVAVTRGDVRQTIIAPGKLVNNNTIDIPSSASGSVLNVHVRSGDVIKKGDPLIQLGGEALIKSIETNRIEAMESIKYWTAQVRDTQFELDRFQIPQRIRDLPPVEAVEKTQAEYHQAVLEFEPYKYLDSENETRKKYAGLLSIARNNYNQATKWFELTSAVELADMKLDQAKRDLAEAETSLEKLTVTAPFDGVILDLYVREGELVQEGAKLLQIAETKALEVLASVIEEEYPLVKVGQSVDLYFDAVPDYEGTGKVASIIPKRVSSDRPLYQVFISIDQVPDGVVEGMTADAEIILAQKKDILVLPRALVRAGSDGKATVSVWVADHKVERDVTIGLRGDVFVEILSGLEEGDKVVGQ